MTHTDKTQNYPKETEKLPESTGNPSEDEFETDFEKVIEWIEGEKDQDDDCEEDEGDDETL